MIIMTVNRKDDGGIELDVDNASPLEMLGVIDALIENVSKHIKVNRNDLIDNFKGEK